MNRAKVSVLEEADKVSLGSLLERKHGAGLEAQVGLEVLGNFTDQTLERELPDEKVSALLELADLTKRDGTRAVTMRLLDTTGDGRRLPGGLCGELLARRFSAGALTSGLLRTGHYARG